jgi:tetratricopeptide (TPR) repeat protein
LLLGSVPAAAVPLAPVDAFAKAWKKIRGAPKSAQSELRAVAAKYPELSDLSLFGQAAAMQVTDPAQAMRLYDSLSGLTNPVAVLAREAASELRYLGSRNPDTTEIVALGELLSKELRSPARIRLRRRLMADFALAGRYDQVDSLFQIRLTETVSLKDVREGLALLAPDTARLSSEALRFALARAMFGIDRSDTARILLDSLAARRNLTSPEWVLLGRILLDLGKAPEAIAAFRKAVEDPREEQAFLWLARGLERVGRLADAQEAQLEFARRWPRSAKAQEVLWGRGMEAEREGNCAEASLWYNRVKDGGGKRADWARLRNGYCWFRIGDFAKAEKILAKERLQATGSNRDAAWYFQSASLDALGKDSLARREYAALAKVAPWSFHGHLARRRLGTDSAFIDSMRLTTDTGALVWPGAQPVALLKSDSVAFIRFLCAQEIGEDWLVREMGKQLDQSVGASGARELALVLWMKALGMERDATPRSRRLLGRLSMEEISRLSKPIMRLFYPMPYLAETKPLLANDTILDASFVHAVMRQESGYDRFAKSGAGAMGLLQLMPPTAKAMAKKSGMKGFRTEQLTDPSVNLVLGVAYMRDLARVWKGQLPLILANYNAGPAPTMRWMDGFFKLPIEQAAEEITYWETRDYVKKCMANYWTYRLLYPESK